MLRGQFFSDFLALRLYCITFKTFLTNLFYAEMNSEDLTQCEEKLKDEPKGKNKNKNSFYSSIKTPIKSRTINTNCDIYI